MPRRDRAWPAVLSPPPRWQIGNLELIVGKYNTILQTMLDVEAPLLSVTLPLTPASAAGCASFVLEPSK